MRFNFHHGQAKVLEHVDLKPAKMYYVPTPFVSRVQIKDVDAGIGRVVLNANLVNGDVEVEQPMAIAQLYILGWPLNVAEVGERYQTVEAVPRPADEVALQELKRLPNYMARAIGVSFGVQDDDFATVLTKTARKITEPWGVFGVKKQYCRRVDIFNPPEGLIFPRPDKSFVTDDLESDPFWSHVDPDVVADLKSKTSPWNIRGLRLRSI